MMPALAAWLHDIDPYAVQLWEGGPIRWYGLSYLLGFVIGFLLVRRVAQVGKSALRPQQVADLIILLAIGVVVGGRLGYVIFYQPALLWTFFDHVPLWGALALQEGGMASHGGMLGAVGAAMWFARRHGLDWAFTIDLLAFGAPLGLFFGRIANFINGELIGRAAPEWLPWAVKFPQEIYNWPTTDPEKWDQLAPLMQDYGSAGSIVHQVQRGNAHVIEFLEPMLVARHPSQFYAALMEGLIVFLVLLWLWRRPRVPGLIASVFAVGYAVMRIANEFFRRPDVHLLDDEFALLGVTRGQWLSALLLAVGVWGVWFSRRRGVEPMGSWRRGPWTPEPEPEPGSQPPQTTQPAEADKGSASKSPKQRSKGKRR